MNKFMSIFVIWFLISSGLGINAITAEDSEKVVITESIAFSEPHIQDLDEYISVSIKEATFYSKEIGNPVLPIYVKVFTFPIGTKIKDVIFTFSNEEKKILSKDILPASEPISFTTPKEGEMARKQSKNEDIYSSENIYPESHLRYQIGTGLDKNSHVLFLTVHYYPITYSPKDNTIYYTPQAQIKVTYEQIQNPINFPDERDLVVIAPSNFSEALQPLIDHKNEYGIVTDFISTEHIFSTYPGRDQAEQIKYFIKDAIEKWGILYMLLVGSIYELPMRTTNVTMWNHFDVETLTDLYYSDIYDSDGMFCTWDSNNNNKFGETGEDQMDMYPDVNIGRLACGTSEEVQVVVDKIIHYETETFNQKWFHNMIFIGGNTFPKWYSPGNEGEKHNKIIMEIMSDFEPAAIWTSKRNFNRRTISKAINEGAGFVDYSGHGFEHGIGTYPPHGHRLKTYLTPYIKDLVNGYELPIIFFDACLTAKLDFTLSDLLRYKEWRIFKILTLLPNINEEMKLSCFAWNFVKYDGGGAIATIGATRTAFGGVDFGCEKLSTEFFKTFDSSETLGQMMTKAQTKYIHDLPEDEFTVQEFTLLGDPSLKIGGYSEDREPPEIEIINPRRGYFHFSGIPLLQVPSDSIADAMSFGGFRLRPIQILAEDDTDNGRDIKINFYVDGEQKGDGKWNAKNKCHEWKWTGWGRSTHTLTITAKDTSGNVASDEMKIWYFSFLP